MEVRAETTSWLLVWRMLTATWFASGEREELVDL